MKPHSLLAVCIVLLATSAVAQQTGPTISAEGGPPDDRASARVLYWNDKANSSAGQFAFDYGRPVWKKDYEDPAKFDGMTKGKVWRMGSNFWTTLDTQLPLQISGKSVAVGSYFLGLRRSADGSKWTLAFIDPGKVRKGRIDAFEIEKAPIEFEAPMSQGKATSSVEKLTITLTYPEADPKNVTLKVAWGQLALTAPIKVTLAE